MFDESFSVPANSSMEIEYEFTVKPASNDAYPVILNMGSVSWQLPADNSRVRYSVPVHDAFDGSFFISAEASERTDKKEVPAIKIYSVRFTGRWFGFDRSRAGFNLYTPFISANNDGSYKIDIPAVFIPERQFFEIEAFFSEERKAIIELSDKKLETYPGNNLIFIPSSLISQGGLPVLSFRTTLSAQEVSSFTLNPCAPPAFPEPIKADPALIINWSQKNWRNKNYEVFRWDKFPSILIFDIIDYAEQDKMLKRLAFFVEKKGFRGRLAPDGEIKELHAWNAHDYRARDLAAFFDAAKKANFPLLDEERQLEKILLNEKIIRESSGSIIAGEGGIVSISRESAEYLRYGFIAHEGFHGIFFTDADFRDFSRRRWEQLPAPAKRFLTSFFDFQQYDIKDEYLLVNEFMAYVLQQPISQASEYFGHNLPLRLESTWRVSSLPQKDEATGTWPALSIAFMTEAEAFSEYVKNRWGLAAGRVWGVQIKK